MGRAVWPADDRGAVLRHSRRGHAAWRPAGDRHTSGGRAARHARRADPRRRQDQHARPASLPRAGRATVHSPRDGGELRTDLPERPEDGRAAVDRTLVRVLVVYFVYRLLGRSFGRESAMLGGLLAAAFFAMPVTAVHQLEESVAQVPLLAACWWWQTAEDRNRESGVWAALAGAALGIALILRLPLIGFVAAFVIMVLLRPVTAQRKLAFLGGLALVIVLQGYSNVLINHQWGYSFIQRLGPMLHPQRLALEAQGYPSSPPWHYVLTLLAALIPPVSVLLLAAAVRGGRQVPLIGVATLAFLLSHSLIANKQERFLLPILPLLLILVVAGLPGLAPLVAPPHRGPGGVLRVGQN